MKKCLLGILLVSFTMILNAGSFTPGNIVILRVGDGSGALSNAAAAGYLDEYTTSGTLVQSIPFPTADAAPNFRITFGGSATSDGALTLSPNSQYVAIGGYQYAIGTASVATTANDRVIALVDQSGNINTITKIFGFSGGNIRGAVTSDGNSIWASGSTGGVRYTTIGGDTTTSTLISTSTSQGLRLINIFNGQLYVSASNTPYYGISTVGTGLPTTTGQSITILPGNLGVSGIGPYGFAISPDGNAMYVADDRATTSNGGLQKWTLSAGTWSLAYTLTSGLTVTAGLRHIAVNWQLANPVIYATTSDAYSAGSKLVSVIDAGSSSAFTILNAGTANIALKGIAFVPGTILPVELSSFSLNTINRTITLNWETKTEINSNEFEIERSGLLSAKWETIEVVRASGNSNAPKQYSYTDKNLKAGKYQYRLKMVDNGGSFKYSNVVETEVALPTNFALNQNYPNPFNPSTKISYSIPSDSKVILDVYNISGEKVGQLVNEVQQAGYYSVEFGKSTIHKNLASGVYLYRIQVIENGTGKDFSLIKKMTLLK